MSDDAPLTVQAYGNLTDEAVRKVADATLGLLDAVTESVLGDRDAIRWRVGPWQFICDGCEVERPTAELPPGWVNADTLDYCPRCVARREAS